LLANRGIDLIVLAFNNPAVALRAGPVGPLAVAPKSPQ